MNAAEVRETLLDVAHHTRVPAPDSAAFQRRVRGVRRRRTATAWAVATGVAVVGLGGFVAADLGADRQADRAPVAGAQAATDRVRGVPVIVDGSLALVQPDGSVERTGQPFAHLVGTTPTGVVGFTSTGDLSRSDGGAWIERIANEPVRVAYLDGDDVVYQTFDGTIRSRGAEPMLAASERPLLPGRLMAAGSGVLVVARGDGRIVVHSSSGVAELALGSDGSIQTADQVEVGGDTIAVHTGSTVELFDLDGTRRFGELGGSVGALSPDGSTYVTGPTLSPLDTHVGEITGGQLIPVRSGAEVVEVAWTEQGLYAVTAGGGVRTLWDCGQGERCESVVDDPTETLRLR